MVTVFVGVKVAVEVKVLVGGATVLVGVLVKVNVGVDVTPEQLGVGVWFKL